jgi:tetratricopeptide (TPR) repeat protein
MDDLQTQSGKSDSTDLVKTEGGGSGVGAGDGGVPAAANINNNILPNIAPVNGRIVGEYIAQNNSNAPPPEMAGGIKDTNSMLDDLLREHNLGPAPTGGSDMQGGVPNTGAATAAQKMAIDNLLMGAKSKMDMGDYRGSLDQLNALLRLDPNNIKALVGKAEVLNQLKLYSESEKSALAALRVDPNNPKAWQQLAWSLLKQKRFKEALEAINRAIALDPNSAVAYAIRAYIKDVLGDRKGALDDMEKAAMLDPRYRNKLEMARQGSKLYDPDADDDAMANTVASALGRMPRWPFAAALAALILMSVVGGLMGRRKKDGPSSGVAPTMIAQRPSAPAFTSQSGGVMIGKYELGQVIGRGGMGEVYEAKDLSLGRRVAIKKVTAQVSELGTMGRQMLLKEAKLVATLHHPSIVDIYEIIEQGDDLFVVFEFVSGKTVHHVLAEAGGHLPFNQTLAILRPVCQALQFAHDQGLVHRDLKPANIMLTEQGHVKLMDFGVARSLADSGPAPTLEAEAGPTSVPRQFARTQTVVGTPSYMSPETGEGVVCKEADVYSLGVTLYEMLAGRLPFPAESTTMDKRAMKFQPASTLVWGIPPGVDEMITYALQPDPARRMKSPAEFLARLEAAAAAAPAPAPKAAA